MSETGKETMLYSWHSNSTIRLKNRIYNQNDINLIFAVQNTSPSYCTSLAIFSLDRFTVLFGTVKSYSDVFERFANKSARHKHV